MDVLGKTHFRWIRMSDDLFRCRMCGEVKDKDEKNQLTFSKWSTKATAKGAACDKCFTNIVNVLATAGFKAGEWKSWPKRGKPED
jgi:hypothetical protein